MELNIWSKSILKAYRNLSRVVKSIDKTFMNICISSRCSSWYDSVINSTLAVTDKLLTLSERKILLINTKVIIDEVLSNMDKDLAKLLILRYIKHYNNEKIASMYRVCVKTITRKFDKAIDNFAVQLKKRGYNSHRIKVLYEKERWLMDIYRQTMNEEIKLDERFGACSKLKLIEI